MSDYALITGNYLALLRGDKSSDEELKSRYPEHMLQAVKRNIKYPEVRSGNLIFKRPLTDFKFPMIRYLIYLSDNYEKGHLPFDGSVSDQPGQVMEMISLVQSLKTEYQNQLDKKKQ